MRKGKRIYVRTPLFEGWAVITGFVACSLYPIETELEEGDSDGHRHKRVSGQDIIEERTIK